MSSPHKTSKALVFDSGVGGLTICKEVLLRLTHLNIQYLMDDDFFPYGVQPDDFLIDRICEVCSLAIHEHNPALIIIACNTASTLALEKIRSIVKIPVIGVVPAIKVAAARSTNQSIGLVATPATVERPYTQTLINDFANNCSVKKLGSSELVIMAESFIVRGQKPDPNELKEIIGSWLQQEETPSHVVLGCTHFPFLTPWLQELWPDVSWIDSGEAIARRADFILNGGVCKKEVPTKESSSEQSSLSIACTSRSELPETLAQNLQAWFEEFGVKAKIELNNYSPESLINSPLVD